MSRETATPAARASEPASTEYYVLALFREQDHLPVFSGTTFEDHVDAYRVLHSSLTRHFWAMAAVAASFAHKCGARGDLTGHQTDIQRFCTGVACSRQHFHRLAATYRAFLQPGNTSLTGLLPSPELSFKHFAVATLADDPVAAVVEAHDEGWSANELQGRLFERRRQAEGERPFSVERARAELLVAVERIASAWPADRRGQLPGLLRDVADEIVQHTLTEADKHELCRMAEEMAVLPVQKHTFLETRKRGGDLDVVPGCAGAPVYRDIIGDVSRASRPAVCRAIQNLLLGKRTRLGALALDVARRRQRGDRTLSRPLLPLAAGDLHAQSTVAEDSVTETIEIERGVLR